MLKYVFVLLVSAVTLSSCFLIGGKRIRGNGNVVTQERSISGFDGVESYGSFEVFITSGNASSVKIEADENLMEYIETDIRNGVLRLKTANRHSISPSHTIKVHVTAPTFTVVKTSGSGSIVGNNEISTNEKLSIGTSGSGDIKLNVRATELSANISGSGNIILAGEANTMDGSIAGSGNIRAGELKTREASVDIAGSGSTSIHADEKLDINIAGSGDVRYSGNAKITSRIAGSGSINKID
jgi:hypothetical protein